MSDRLPLKEELCLPNEPDDDLSPVTIFLITATAAISLAIYISRRHQPRSTSTAPGTLRTTTSPTAACALVRAWLAVDLDPVTRAQTQATLSDYLRGTPATRLRLQPHIDALDPVTATTLHFGTAGVRANVAPGYNHLNAVTVINVAQAVAAASRPFRRPVSVAYDARHSSRRFALLITQALHHAGATVRLFSTPVPTPLLAFDAHTQRTQVAFIVTASHNPPQDNGIKVYGSDAIQIRADVAMRVEAKMPSTIKPHQKYSLDEAYVRSTIPLTDPLQDSRLAYKQAIAAKIRFQTLEQNARAPPAVYTACHGVGHIFVVELFKQFGLPDPIPCAEQCAPDGDFPTLPFPNPEERGALDLAIATAQRENARLILANDPDADRFAAAELDAKGAARTFTGDEIATLLTDYITTQLHKQDAHVDMSQFAVVTSTVSSKILSSMARERGFSFHESLTGFKWLNKTAVDLEGEGKTVILTYEEAIGFNVTQNIVRDKDGISAAAVFYEMAAVLYESGSSLVNRLNEVTDECGVHLAHNGYLRLSGNSPSTKEIFDAARDAGLPNSFAQATVISYRDMTKGIDSAEADDKSRFPADPTSQFLTFRCAQGSSDTNDCPLIIHLRGSGTGKLSSTQQILAYSNLPIDDLLF